MHCGAIGKVSNTRKLNKKGEYFPTSSPQISFCLVARAPLRNTGVSTRHQGSQAGRVAGGECAGAGAPEAHTAAGRGWCSFTHLPRAPNNPGAKRQNIVNAVF